MDSLKVVDSELLDMLRVSLDRDEFTFYRIERKGQEEYWDLLGILCINTKDVAYDIVLMHIDAEQLLWDGFAAEEETSGRMQCVPCEYLQIIQFLERLLGKVVENPHRPLTCFTPLSEQELLNYHYPSRLARLASDHFYRYASQKNPSKKINIVACPSWQPHWEENQVSSIKFRTFFPQQLEDPRFDLAFDTTCFGIITFDQLGLEELICLLKQHVL